MENCDCPLCEKVKSGKFLKFGNFIYMADSRMVVLLEHRKGTPRDKADLDFLCREFWNAKWTLKGTQAVTEHFHAYIISKPLTDNLMGV